MLLCGGIFIAAGAAAGYLAFAGRAGLPRGLRWLFGQRSGIAAIPSLEDRPADAESPVRWSSWGREAFEQARGSRRLVLLQLSPRWGHWTHLMDAETYSDPAVAAWIRKHVVAVRLDPHERPDIARRYLSRVPTAALLLPSGESLSQAAYVPSGRFLAWAEQVSGSARKSWDEIDAAARRARKAAHEKAGSLLGPQRDTLWRQMSPAERRSAAERAVSGGLAAAEKLEQAPQRFLRTQLVSLWKEASLPRWRRHLKESLRLEDPVWGGFYRYSSCADWKCPEFERTLSGQAAAIESLALSGEPDLTGAALKAVAFVERFLKQKEAYADAMDSDVRRGSSWIDGARYFALDERGRLRLGLPEIDRSAYTAPNAELATAYLLAGRAMRRAPLLESGLRLLTALEPRMDSRGALRRQGSGGPCGLLEDQLAMARAELAAFACTRREPYLHRARKALSFALGPLRDPSTGGLLLKAPEARVAGDWPEAVDPDASAAAALVADDLARLSGKESDGRRARAMLEWAMAREGAIDPVLLARVALRLR